MKNVTFGIPNSPVLTQVGTCRPCCDVLQHLSAMKHICISATKRTSFSVFTFSGSCNSNIGVGRSETQIAGWHCFVQTILDIPILARSFTRSFVLRRSAQSRVAGPTAGSNYGQKDIVLNFRTRWFSIGDIKQ